ncbi:hypothetical protein D3C86_2159260 [compost metagenome]
MAFANQNMLVRLINSNGDAFIEHVTIAVEASSLYFRILSVGDYAAIQLEYVLEAFVLEHGSQHFATNSARAIR